jgi:NTE family protein
MPDARFDIVTGTSAGAINAVFLASHRGPFTAAVEDLQEIWRDLHFENVFRVEGTALGANLAKWSFRLVSGGSFFAPEVRGLLDTQPLRELLESCLTTVDGEIVGISRNVENGSLDAFALTTLNYATGQTVTWVQGSDIETWERPHRLSRRTRFSVEHVMASAALPMLFPAVRLGDSWYGDGGVRLAAPLAPAIHLGADRVLAIATRYHRSREEANRPLTRGYPPPAQVLGSVLNAIFLDVIDQDALFLERVNRLLEHVPPAERGILRPIELMVLRPSKDLGRIAAEYERDLPRAFRFLTRGLGTRETLSPDFLSLLMFHPEYLARLVAIGEEDAEARGEELARFLGSPGAAAAGESPVARHRSPV